MTDEYKLIQYQAQNWFCASVRWTIPVRAVACLFVPYEQRLEPETYKMLRFMHVFDLDRWCRHINMWLHVMGARNLEVVGISEERVRSPIQSIDWSRGVTATMSEVVRVERCFTIQKTFQAVTQRSKYIQHNLLTTWDFEDHERQASIARVRQALIDAKDLDFYEDLKRWNKERQERHYRYGIPPFGP